MQGAWRVDVHQHLLSEELKQKAGADGVAGGALPSVTLEQTFAYMEKCGIEAVVHSIPFPMGAIQAPPLARPINDAGAEYVAKHPARFGALASLPLTDVSASLVELEYALDTLKLDGVCLVSNAGGRYLGDPAFVELFAELDRRKATVFLHPNIPAGIEHVKATLPAFLVEFMFDTTRTIGTLLAGGIFERFSNIRFIVAHAGGAVPFLTGRLSMLDFLTPDSVPAGVKTYLGRLYYEMALSANVHSLSSLQTIVDESHILLGTDFPLAPHAAENIANLEAIEGVGQEQLTRFQRTNALPLFPRLHAALDAAGAAQGDG